MFSGSGMEKKAKKLSNKDQTQKTIDPQELIDSLQNKLDEKEKIIQVLSEKLSRIGKILDG
mgnify:CR=1 FL=1